MEDHNEAGLGSVSIHGDTVSRTDLHASAYDGPKRGCDAGRKWRATGEGAEPTSVRQQSTAVGRDQAKEFVELLDEANFWELSTAKLAAGVDGQEWLLEGGRRGEYHAVDRWDGAMEDRFHNACEYLYKLGQSATK